MPIEPNGENAEERLNRITDEAESAFAFKIWTLANPLPGREYLDEPDRSLRQLLYRRPHRGWLMGKKERILQQRQNRHLKKMGKEIEDLGILRQAFVVSQAELQEARRKRLFWRNLATAGIPSALLAGLALGVAVAHEVLSVAR